MDKYVFSFTVCSGQVNADFPATSKLEEFIIKRQIQTVQIERFNSTRILEIFSNYGINHDSFAIRSPLDCWKIFSRSGLMNI